MSFILDALKKSETERLRKNPAGIASIAESSRQKSSSKWIWVVLVLLAINLVAVAGLIFLARPEPVEMQTPVAVARPEAISVPAASSETVTEIQREQTAIIVDGPDDRTVEPSSGPVNLPVIVSDSEQVGTDYDRAETFNDLRAKGQLVLPDLHLDIHVYSARVADRFVFVNMSKYKENGTLTEGPRVKEITPNGVILDYRGIVFLLPRE